MATKKLTPDPKLFAAMAACVAHARALLESAKAVLISGHPNIAYHLATLALEEVGRHGLIGVQFIAQNEAVPPEWPKKHEQDHIKKLFWAFFSAQFDGQVLTAKSLQEMTELAERIHDMRLAGLYVGNNEESLSIPANAVTKEQAEQLTSLAEARLGMAEAKNPREEVTQEEVDLQTWFLTAADDPEHRKMIF